MSSGAVVGRGRPTWLVLPPLALILVAFVVPVILMLMRSFSEPPGGLTWYRSFLGAPSLVKIMLRTIWTAVVVTSVSVAIGYPFAYLAASSSAPVRRALLGIVSVSLFISLVVRCYAWLALLDRNGAVNFTLRALGLEGLQVVGVHNFAGVVIGVLQYTLPFVILPIYDVMRRLDPQLLRAASSLGAGAVNRFIRVYLPLTLPGVVAGCAIAFISTLGYYIAPSLLGGPQNMMVGELIASKILTTVEWGQGTAIASVLLVVALLFFALFRRVTLGGRG